MADGRAIPPWALVVGLVAGIVAGVVGSVVFVAVTEDEADVAVAYEPATTVRLTGELTVDETEIRGTASYEGYGVWIDAWDFSPRYAGPAPPVTADGLGEMADMGVRTVYLQAARLDDLAPEGTLDPWLLAEMLVRAHDHGLDVVAWYLPKWTEDDTDLERLEAIEGFEVLGHRFDGVALDIEWIGELDDETRTDRLVNLTATYHGRHPVDPLGAIVQPPVLMEVVNDRFWPGFPWRDLAPYYDVWLPMSYWSGRTESSGYHDGYAYNEESVRRLRNNVGDDAVPVHPIGGIGGTDGIDDPPDPPEPLATIDEIEAFARSLTDTGSVGGSIYDWNTLEPEIRERVADLVTNALATPAA